MKNVWLFVVCVALSLTGCGGGGGSTTPPPGQMLAAPAVAGNWSGTWNNTTFGSSGGASAIVTVDSTAHTAVMRLTLMGNVFGAGQAQPDTFMGSYDSSQMSVSGMSPTFGAFTMTVTSAGNVTGSGTPARGAFSFTGAVTPTTFNIAYTIRNTGMADVTGTMSMTKS